MSTQPIPSAEASPARQHPTEVYGDFLNCLGRAVKCVSLYGAGHPLTVDYLKEASYQLGQIVARTRSDGLVLTFAGERLLVNGARATETSQAREVMRGIFGAHGLTSLTFLAAVTPPELSTLCELAAASANASGERDLRDLLAARSVTHILCETEPTWVEKPPKSFALEPPFPPAVPAERVPAPRPEPAPRSAPVIPAAPPVSPTSSPERKSPTLSFGTLLKTIVESASADPGERLQLYQEAAGLVKEALNRRVEEATQGLEQEKRRVVGEQARAERVLSTVADGKVVVDKEGNVLMMNAAAEQISGKRLIDMVGKPLSESVDPEVQMVTMSEDLELPRDGQASKQIRVIAQEEVERALRRSLALVQDDAGRLVGTYAVLPDVVKYKETLRMQEEFLSRVTHDLKAPLSSLSCGLELIATRMGPRMAPEETSFVDICLRNTRQLRRMINEILDFSKLESGQMTVHPVATQAAGMLTEAVEGLGPWAKTRGLSLCAAPIPGGLSVLADPIRVVQVLTNLVSNAIKSTPEGGRIVVAAEAGAGKDRGFEVFSVKDTGCGIPKEGLPRVFEKFFQVEGAQARREGVGLGLTIVQELVALHRGRVWVESEVGAGSSFFFTIPLAEEESPWEP